VPDSCQQASPGQGSRKRDGAERATDEVRRCFSASFTRDLGSQFLVHCARSGSVSGQRTAAERAAESPVVRPSCRPSSSPQFGGSFLSLSRSRRDVLAARASPASAMEATREVLLQADVTGLAPSLASPRRTSSTSSPRPGSGSSRRADRLSPASVRGGGRSSTRAGSKVGDGSAGGRRSEVRGTPRGAGEGGGKSCARARAQ